MNKKSGRILHITLITIFIFTATSIIFKNSDILTSSKGISAINSNVYLQDKTEVSDSSDPPKEPTIDKEELAPPAPSPDTTPTLPSAESSIITTASSTNKTTKAPSSTISSGVKNQKNTASPNQPPKPAAYTTSSNGRKYSISAEEKSLFARLVSAEASGESYEGKLAVATVVINRVTSGVFSGSVTEVIMGQEGGHYQFTPVLDGRINNPPSADALKAVDQVLGGYRSFPAKIMWFLNPQKSTSGWIINTKSYFETIGKHDFYF